MNSDGTFDHLTTQTTKQKKMAKAPKNITWEMKRFRGVY